MELYLTHRLSVAGYKGGNLFEINAMSSLFKASRGIPRLINILSHKSMMSACGQGTKYVNKNNMQAAIKDTEDAQLRHTDNKKYIWLIAAAGLLTALTITYVFLR
jgi:MSHA biogenesis protein MshM